MDNEGFLTLGKTKLLPYKPRPFKPVEYMTNQEILDGAGGTLIVDIEKYENYYLIGFKDVKTKKYIQLEIPFNEKMLSWIMHNYTCIGFNSIKYDLPMIWLSYSRQNLDDLKKLSNALILENLFPTQAQKDFNFTIYKTSTIDLIEVAPLRGSLKLYGARLHAPRIQDLPFDITKPLSDDEKKIVANYNINDLDTTEQLFLFMRERIELRQAMSAEYKENLLSKSDAQIAEIVLTKEVEAIRGAKIKRPIIKAGTSYNYKAPSYLKYQSPHLNKMLETILASKFVVNEFGKIILPEALKSSVQIGKGIYRLGIGGLHSSEKNVSYKTTDAHSIVDRDFTSFYPLLVLMLQLYPPAMGPHFLTAYDRIINSRIAAKIAKRITEANGKKIVINGAGGKFSDEFSNLYAPDLTILMTVTGQLTLLLFIELLELSGIRVISANTDGIVMIVGKDQEKDYEYCVNYLENLTGLKTEETRYAGYYARDVNSYFAVKVGATSNKDVKVKGPYSEVGSQSGTQLDTNPVNLICSNAVKALLWKGTLVEETIRGCTDFTRFVTVRQCKAPGAHKNNEYLGKVVRFYFAKGELGTINYVESGNKVPDSDGGKPCMDLPESFPNDIDYAKYIELTKEILYDINYERRSQQIKFF